MLKIRTRRSRFQSKATKWLGLFATVLSPLSGWWDDLFGNKETYEVLPDESRSKSESQEKIKYQVWEISTTTVHESGAKTNRSYDTLVHPKGESNFINESKKKGDSIKRIKP